MKPEQINKLYFSDADRPLSVGRRDFLKQLGGGIFVIFSLSGFSFINGSLQRDEDEAAPQFNAYLRIKEDGAIDCFSGKIEMGQGITTSLAQILAEELEVSIERVNMVMGDTELCLYDAGTWGSMTTRFHDPLIRAAAAEARTVLIELASEKLKIPISELKAEGGKIVSVNDKGKSITYADLTKGKKIIRGVTEKPVLKKPGEFKVIGKPFLRRDAVQKVTGTAKYTADLQFPGMLYAKIVRPPVLDSKLVNVDTSAAESLEGVRIVRESDFIAVLHTNPEIAARALALVKAEWKTPEPKADNETIFNHILKNATNRNVRYEGGSPDVGKKESSIIVESEFHDGYRAHSPIETHAATAIFEKGKLTIWASTQTPFGTRDEIAGQLSLPKEMVHMKQIYLGGGFGGKIYNRQAIEASRIAKMMEGTPIQTMWTRQEEFMYDTFRPAAVVKVASGIDKTGKLKFWNFDTHCPGDRGTELFYQIPNHRTTVLEGENVHPFPTGAWRAPGNSSNTFARESQIDIMALNANMDPAEFRLLNMNNSRAIKSLKLATEKFGWTPIKSPSGKGWGMAVGVDAGTFVTVIVEVGVDKKTGAIKVKRAVVGQDMGQVVNPQGAVIEAEGCVNMGLAYSLCEDLEYNWKEVKSRNFGNYQITTFSMVPEKIETVFADVMDQPPQGGGEPAIICMGAAIANAVFDACGARIFRLPILPKRVLAALKKG